MSTFNLLLDIYQGNWTKVGPSGPLVRKNNHSQNCKYLIFNLISVRSSNHSLEPFQLFPNSNKMMETAEPFLTLCIQFQYLAMYF